MLNQEHAAQENETRTVGRDGLHGSLADTSSVLGAAPLVNDRPSGESLNSPLSLDKEKPMLENINHVELDSAAKRFARQEGWFISEDEDIQDSRQFYLYRANFKGTPEKECRREYKPKLICSRYRAGLNCEDPGCHRAFSHGEDEL